MTGEDNGQGGADLAVASSVGSPPHLLPSSAPSSSSVRRKTANWSQMPVELLEKIVGNLDEIADRFNSGAVCKHWHSALKSSPALPRVRLPWLLLRPRGQVDDDRKILRFCSFFKNKPYNIKHNLDRFTVNRLCSSDSGRLLLTNLKSTFHGVCPIFNPITGAQISLPQLPDFISSFALISSKFINISPKDESFVVMMSFCSGWLLCYRSDEKPVSSWTLILIDDIMHDEFRTEQFTYHRGHYFILGFNGRSTVIVDPNTTKVVSVIPPLVESDNSDWKQYFVQSSSRDELFMVIEPSIDLSKRFEVFRWDSSEQENRWSKVRSLGSDTLFKDEHGIMALPRNNSSTFIRENCIVFMDKSDSDNDINIDIGSDSDSGSNSDSDSDSDGDSDNDSDSNIDSDRDNSSGVSDSDSDNSSDVSDSERDNSSDSDSFSVNSLDRTEPALSLFDIEDDSVEKIPCRWDIDRDQRSWNLHWFLPVL